MYSTNIDELMALYNQPKKYIGYWRKNFYNICHELPFPYPNLKKLNQIDIINKTISILNKYSIIIRYMGYSSCRICDLQKNDKSEYLISYNKNTYVIPKGYFHYLTEHNVKIDDMLIEIVNHYETLNDET